MLSLATWTTALAVGLGSGAAPLTAADVLESPHRHVRAADRGMRTLLKTGYEQSATFAALLRRLEVSDVIVYVEEVSRLPGALEGRMLVVPPAHGFRYVRIQVARRGSPSDVISVIGHELRHAVEVAEADDVVDDAALVALYRRIGIAQGHNVFDTRAAQETGKQVLRELAA